MTAHHDVVIVGGGIAGASMATVLARNGVDVLVLEKTERFSDINRGEMMWPWGVGITRDLDLYDVLLGSGATVVPTLTRWNDGEATHVDLGAFVPGVDGTLNLAHPRARQALLDAARSAGADVRRGATMTGFSPGPPARVEWRDGETQRDAGARLVVGADGRASRLRRLAGIDLHAYPISHFATGLHVRGDGIPMDANVDVDQEEWMLLSFPQGNGYARVYHCFAASDRHRYAGRGAVERFLAASDVDRVPYDGAWSNAKAVGPIGTFPCGDAEADPVAPGVALIGDAGGYNNYQIGQGLSLAYADVASLSERLLETDEWTPESLTPYAEERRERLGRVRELARLNGIRTAGFRDEPERRRRIDELFEDEVFLKETGVGFFTGFAGMDVTAADLHDAVDAFERRIDRELTPMAP